MSALVKYLRALSSLRQVAGFNARNCGSFNLGCPKHRVRVWKERCIPILSSYLGESCFLSSWHHFPLFGSVHQSKGPVENVGRGRRKDLTASIGNEIPCPQWRRAGRLTR
ncbi:hypothetical protein BV22DRAFT_781897 [Leucogyrophana mollusca]|uniref:Uncharacterized protein n=1 Tax=Leucogyrophana mollusca TaxID=85980 RepID=A0ACB8B5L8_9AGAM|nr:hypothetical protein BV22DRAFT_781897 [Leucogyrophana mollusca]